MTNIVLAPCCPPACQPFVVLPYPSPSHCHTQWALWLLTEWEGGRMVVVVPVSLHGTRCGEWWRLVVGCWWSVGGQWVVCDMVAVLGCCSSLLVSVSRNK